MNQGLEGSDSPWGSNGFALMADVELRQLSAGRAGLEDSLRLILAKLGGFSATTDTNNMLAIADSINPEPVLRRLAARYLPGAPVDFDALPASLGVHKNADETVTFDETAPLANVRHWLLEGGPGSRVDHIPIPVPPD